MNGEIPEDCLLAMSIRICGEQVSDTRGQLARTLQGGALNMKLQGWW
jgi:hypothetical protein